MASGQVQLLVALLEDAFDGDEEHSLLGNMRNVDDAAWIAVPPGGARPIAELFVHAATGSWAYDDGAFRGRLRTWDARYESAPDSREPAIAWARDGHERLLESVAALDDSDLDGERVTHWGGHRETWRIIFVAAKHNLYHAGEINHARALLQADDAWRQG